MSRRLTSKELAPLTKEQLERIDLVNKPLPRIKEFDTHVRTARWAGCGLGFGSSARRAIDESDNR